MEAQTYVLGWASLDIYIVLLGPITGKLIKIKNKNLNLYTIRELNICLRTWWDVVYLVRSY